MAIIQISKIQVRSGNLVDLPQLDEAEFGWASDAKRLFIGDQAPIENVEVLTGYSQISFSQIDGSVGNLNIDANTLANGQILTYDGNNWVNRGGLAGGLINLGNVENVKIGGGAIGYVLETDGSGNLSWTSKGVITLLIQNITQSINAVITFAQPFALSSGQKVTITEVVGMTQVNGNDYYLGNITSTTANLYTNPGLTTPLDSSGFSPYISNGKAVATIINSSALAAGSTNSVQYNNAGILAGSANLIFTGSNLDLIGTFSATANVIAGNVYANSGTIGASLLTGTLTTTNQPNISNVGTLTGLNVSSSVNAVSFVSNVTTGTAPLTVASATKVTNLNADFLDGYDSSSSATAATIVLRTGDGSIIANLLYGTIATNAQPNITSVGTLSSLGVSGNITAANITANTGVFTGNAAGLTNIPGGNVTGQVANALVAGTVYTAAQPNITSVGTLTSLAVTGTATLGTTNTTILTTGASANNGTITGNWTLSSGSKLEATYADLAEYYHADQSYDPGTVLEFGGDFEVTVAEDATNRVAGVVSSNPAYVMNATCKGEHVVAIALQGRVPVKVKGKIRKGDMMISAGNGYARPSNNPTVGSVIGKSLENFDGIEGIIEIAIGRL